MNAQAKAIVKKVQAKKHKSMSAFCRAAGIDRLDWQKMSIRKEMTKEEQKRILDALAETSPETQGIPREKLELLRSKLEEAGGVHKFCKDNPQFERRHVYIAYNGEYVTQSKFTTRLMEFLGI